MVEHHHRPVGSYPCAQGEVCVDDRIILYAIAIAAILVSTWWVSDLKSTLVSGGPWLLLLWIGYRVSAAARSL